MLSSRAKSIGYELENYALKAISPTSASGCKDRISTGICGWFF